MQRVDFVLDLSEDVDQVAEVVFVDEQLAVGVEFAISDVDLEEVEDRRQAILMSERLL